LEKEKEMAEKFDVIIIGGGVTGCAVARELSRYHVNACLLEKEEDVCDGTSKANSAICHGGYDTEPGTLKSRFNREGNRRMAEVSKELDFPFKPIGSLVLCKSTEELPKLQALYEKGLTNGIDGLKILSQEEVAAMEPNITEKAVAALYAEKAGIVDPFLMTVAFAENAFTNGVQFRFNTKVMKIEKAEGGYRLETGSGEYFAKAVVNAAGVYADVFHNMVSSRKIRITARKGEYCLLDRSDGNLVSHVIFELPNPMGKGVLITPTIHGNLMIGPTAVDVEDRESTNTTAAGMENVIDRAADNLKNLPRRDFITSFAGLRAHEDSDDFVIGEAEGAENFFDCAGIESPGLTSAPAIGTAVSESIALKMNLSPNPDFNPVRKGILKPSELTAEERNELIAKEPSYGRIICRCESVSEGEILDAIRRPLGARSLDGVKRRVRAGMGRCQAGFCSPKTMAILNRELGMPMEEITKTGAGSEIVEGRTKENDR
jgi:glycerol-3-phosphate dehydrogenase